MIFLLIAAVDIVEMTRIHPPLPISKGIIKDRTSTAASLRSPHEKREQERPKLP
jgi:hypothetical protein